MKIKEIKKIISDAIDAIKPEQNILSIDYQADNNVLISVSDVSLFKDVENVEITETANFDISQARVLSIDIINNEIKIISTKHSENAENSGIIKSNQPFLIFGEYPTINKKLTDLHFNKLKTTPIFIFEEPFDIRTSNSNNNTFFDAKINLTFVIADDEKVNASSFDKNEQIYKLEVLALQFLKQLSKYRNDDLNTYLSINNISSKTFERYEISDRLLTGIIYQIDFTLKNFINIC